MTTDNDVGDTRPTAVADRDDTAGRPVVEPDTEIDRSREEVVGSGMVEPHGPASLAGGERTSSGSGEGRGNHGAAAGPVGRDESGLPIPGYLTLTVPEIIRHAGAMSIDRLREVKDYEKSHRRRKTLLTKLERLLRNPGGAGKDDHNPNRP